MLASASSVLTRRRSFSAGFRPVWRPPEHLLAERWEDEQDDEADEPGGEHGPDEDHGFELEG